MLQRNDNRGIPVLALVVGNAATAQSALPPPDVADTPSSTASEPSVKRLWT